VADTSRFVPRAGFGYGDSCAAQVVAAVVATIVIVVTGVVVAHHNLTTASQVLPPRAPRAPGFNLVA
jgi:hypothetical protein